MAWKPFAVTPQAVYDYDDLKQIGYMGLCKAVLTDKPGRGEFSTYAYIVIRNELYSGVLMAASCFLALATQAVTWLAWTPNRSPIARLL